MAANPYVEARREWDERYADLVLGKRNWQIAAGGLLLLSLILASGMVWLISQSRYIPYVLEVDKLGYALTVPQPLTPTSVPDVTARMQRYEVAAFIRNARSVTSDSQVEHQMLNALLAHARGAADRFLDAYYHSDGFTHNPFKLAEKQTVSIQIDSILQLSPSSYQVRWSEQQRDLNGVVIGAPTHWEAVLQTQIVPPNSDAAIISNPLGFYVTQSVGRSSRDNPATKGGSAMKSIAAGSVTLALLLSACASQQQSSAPPPLKIVTEAPAESPATPPPPTGAQLLAQQPAEVQAAIKEHQQDSKWPVYRTAEYTIYPYNQKPEPAVDCAPLRTTDIQLQPGDTITDVALGDTERWMATPAASGDPRNAVPHLAVKPQVPGIETNLTIYTTKHIYHLLLRSRGRAMQEVEFYYPDELSEEMKDADAAATKAKQEAVDPPGDSDDIVKVAAVDPALLNFAYTVAGANLPWKPIRAFDDGSHVYVQMPAGMKSSEAPALLINAGSGTQMVNYRIKGNYYVVDRLFSDAILVSGVGRDQDRVTISYAGGAR